MDFSRSTCRRDRSPARLMACAHLGGIPWGRCVMSATKPPGHAGVEQHNNADGSQPGDVRSNAGSTEDGLVIGGAVVLMTTNSWYYRDTLPRHDHGYGVYPQGATDDRGDGELGCRTPGSMRASDGSSP